ncbi:Uma2 family endonuclease [Sphaerothrix gracilis]|uniref:Uma2 family endonuclease n=1 Tax=Sphaerothrix gracilis TaxID=3151835 RepID=UPI0031FBA524
MTPVSIASLTLDTFLELPETEPASEFISNQILQKSMPQGEHSLLQSELIKVINAAAQPNQTAYAFPELRCVFGGAAIVPDVSVFRWQRIPRAASGRIANRFETYPDWAIEILSPDQSQTKLLAKLLHCIEQGTELGWLLDPGTDSILTISADSRLQLYQGAAPLPVLSGIELTLSAERIFGWLSLPA